MTALSKKKNWEVLIVTRWAHAVTWYNENTESSGSTSEKYYCMTICFMYLTILCAAFEKLTLWYCMAVCRRPFQWTFFKLKTKWRLIFELLFHISFSYFIDTLDSTNALNRGVFRIKIDDFLSDDFATFLAIFSQNSFWRFKQYFVTIGQITTTFYALNWSFAKNLFPHRRQSLPVDVYGTHHQKRPDQHRFKRRYITEPMLNPGGPPEEIIIYRMNCWPDRTLRLLWKHLRGMTYLMVTK